MAGSRALRKVQLGLETTAGTAVAATAIWRGMGLIKDNREVIFPQEDVGIIGGTDRSYQARVWSTFTMPSGESTFEQLPYIFQAGIQTAAASVDGSGSDYIWVWDSPTTAQNTTSTYTIEGGDDQQAEEFDYAFVEAFTLSGEAQGALMLTADWFGREASNTTFTGALTLDTVEEILVNNASLYIDASGGTIGSTEVSGTIYGVEITVTTGLRAFWLVDGSTDFNLSKQTGDEILIRLTYEHNASAVTEKASYRSGATRLVRLQFTGSDVTTAGTSYSAKTFILDVAGVYEDWDVLDERDGNDVVTATLRVRYSDTDTLKAQWTIVNELSALT